MATKVKLKKKSKGGNKGKGKDFEREISGLLSLQLSNGEHDDWVWHTGSSGARGTTRKKKGKSVDNKIVGDLTAAKSEAQFFFDFWSIELKSGYYKSKRVSKKTQKTHISNWSINDLVDGNELKPTFLGFWDQAIGDAAKSGREPMLIFRRNNRKVCVAFAKDLFDLIQGTVGNLRVIPYIMIHPRWYKPIVMVSLEDYFKWGKESFQKDFIEDYLKPCVKTRS